MEWYGGMALRPYSCQELEDQLSNSHSLLTDVGESALGHKRTFGCGPAMSASPSRADMLRAAINVR